MFHRSPKVLVTPQCSSDELKHAQEIQVNLARSQLIKLLLEVRRYVESLTAQKRKLESEKRQGKEDTKAEVSELIAKDEVPIHILKLFQSYSLCRLSMPLI